MRGDVQDRQKRKETKREETDDDSFQKEKVGCNQVRRTARRWFRECGKRREKISQQHGSFPTSIRPRLD